MGTIAARDALRVLTLTEQVAAACLLAAVQGVELRLARPTPSPVRSARRWPPWSRRCGPSLPRCWKIGGSSPS